MSVEFARNYIAQLDKRAKKFTVGHPVRIALIEQINSIKMVMASMGHTL